MSSENQKNNKSYDPAIDSVSGWKIFSITFLMILYYSQSAREMLLDRGVITVVLPLLLVLILGGMLAALLLKFLSHYIVLILFGLLGAIGRILLSIADQPVTINDSSYPIYNAGIYLSFLAFAPTWIAIFGIINLQTSRIQSYQFSNPVNIAVSGIVIGFVYHWLFRINELAEYSLLNIILGIIGVITYAMILNESITYIRMIPPNQSEKVKNRHNAYLYLLKAAPRDQFPLKNHYTKRSDKIAGSQKIRASVIMIAIPIIIYLSLPMSFPELYSYLSGMSLQIVVIAFIIGMAIGVILTIYAKQQLNIPESDTKNRNFANLYMKSIPIGAIISAIFFGLASFFESPTPIMIFVYVITGWTVSALFLLVVSYFTEQRLLHFDKLMMGYITITNLASVAIRLLTIERYIPYLEFIVGLSFALPSFLIFKYLSSQTSKGGRHI